MLDLREAAKLARSRIDHRLEAAESQKKGVPRSAAIVQQGSSFRAHLIEALKRGGDERQSPSPAPSALFLAFPEKLLAKWYYLSFGPQRTQKNDGAQPAVDPRWKAWDALGNDSLVVNFARTDPKAVLVTHGLSAIDDSVLLLAELGRAFRASQVLKAPIQVLLAGINWISHNRSLKKFDLSEDAVERGLLVCQDRRLRLYEAMGAKVTIHEIVEYAKKGAISRKKIGMIASRYLELAAFIWGEENINTQDPLSNSAVASIGKPLHLSISERSPLRVLSQFPGALQKLESALAPHLGVVRTLAQRFRLLGLDTFSYYFAQYYAQDGYRGTHVKIAPISERYFDEPFDELDDSFRSWGEGHEPGVEAGSKPGRRRILAAVYLPQYRIGDWELLPYTPLSLSAVAQAGGRIEVLKQRVILVSDNTCSQAAKVEELLRSTMQRGGAARLNRLMYDILSFVQAVLITRGRATIDEACRKLNLRLDDLLCSISRELPSYFSVECEESAVAGDLWLSWLDSIERDSAPRYVPCHILLATLTEDDWTPECFAACSSLLVVANAVATRLSA